jgi:hypothetical protein
MTQLWEENIIKYGFNMYADWQPIETAPKNGTIILACALQEDNGIYISMVMWMKENETLIGLDGKNIGLNAWATYYGDSVPVMLTHWMHLPDMPKI